MFLHAEKIPVGSTIHTDICVIGAGAAGISFAREFIGSSTRVCVLESGQIQTTFNRILIWTYRLILRTLNRLHLPTVVTDFILNSIVSTFAYDPLYDFECPDLHVGHQSRRRSFGGTMIAWGGKWVRYSKIDFIKRPWVPNSGWPIIRDELVPYYVRASKSLHAPDPTNDTFDENFLAGGAFETSVFFVQKKNAQNWGLTLRSDFEQSQNVTVHTGAHVVSINKDKEGARIANVSVRTHTGNQYTVSARYFVLACGGIENPRLLLISNIGNEHDQVGRYYMDHPMGKCGIIKPRYQINLYRYWGQGAMNVGFRLSEAVQEKESILNSHIFLESYESTLLRSIKKKILGNRVSTTIAVRNHLEQVPSSTNRVTLSDMKDPLGLPRARVSWSLSDLDKKSIVTIHRYLQEHIAQAGIGILQSPLLERSPSFKPVSRDAAHHMGTTRMGQDPLTSVVDKNSKIHGIENMFVTGSSVFPTSGSANPTATICALAIRLADHLKKIL